MSPRENLPDVSRLPELLRSAQESARRSESRLGEVLESISDAFYSLDREWRFTYVNRRACFLWGKEAEELLGKVVWDVFPMAKSTESWSKMRQAMEDKRPSRFETFSPYLRAWQDVSLHPSENGLSVYFSDITERKEVEAARERSLMRFEILAETAGELLRSQDPQKAVDSLCRKVLEHLGCQVFFNYLKDEKGGRLRLNACAGIPPEEAARIEWLDLGMAVCGCVARDGAPIVAERIGCAPDERTELVRSYGVQAYACHPLMDGTGKVLGTLSFGTRDRESFSANDVSLMRAVTDLVSVAMVRLRNQEELKLQASRLEESQGRLRMAQRASRLGIWDYDVASGNIHWDERLKEMWGVDPDRQVTYDLFLSGLHPEDRPRIDAEVAKSTDPGSDGRYYVEYRARNFKTGEWHWEGVTGQTTFRDGRAVKMIGTTQDITERKLAEEALRRSEEKSRLAQEVAGIGVWDRDLQTDGVHWSEEMFRLFGLDLSRDRASLETWYRAIHPEDRASVRERIATAGRDRARLDHEYRIMRPDGALRWIHAIAEVSHDFAGQPLRIIGTCQDITERKLAEEELRRSEQAMRQANERLEQRVHERTAELSKAVGNLQTEVLQRRRAESELQRTNRALRMLGASNEAVVRMDDEERLMSEVCRIAVDLGGYRMAWVGVPREDEAKTIRAVACTDVESGYPESVRLSWGDNELGRGPTGTAIRLGTMQVATDFLNEEHLAPWREQARKAGFRSSIALPLKHGGTVFGALTIHAAERAAFSGAQGEVLTELAEDLSFGIMALRMRAQLRESRDRLRALAGEITMAEQRERQRLAKFLHDHLQQLLVGAKFRAAILGRAGDELVGKGAEEIQGLLDEAIAASRSLTAELSPPILHEGGLKAGLEWLARWMADKHGLTVDLSAEDGLPRLTDGTRILLFESVRELLFNSVKHARVRSAAVNVRLVDGKDVQITVTDSGKGFDPSKPKHSGKGGGGFGLFSIRERLGLLGGGMEIRSSPGQGCRVLLSAPVGPEEERGGDGADAELPQARPPRPRKRRGGARIRVLIADDHAVMREGLCRLLDEEEDIEVVGQAVDGREAVELAGSLTPDVVLMDTSMPRLNGVEATRTIHGKSPDIRVIGLSMFMGVEGARAMRDAGAVEYLTKSGPAADLVAAIRKAAVGRPAATDAGAPAKPRKAAPKVPSRGVSKTKPPARRLKAPARAGR